MTKTINRHSFTLIEMLVVIGIASLLFALLGPAFQNMIRGNAVERHANGLKLGMERARALAIANRRYVALLLPNKETDTAGDEYNYQCGGYRIAYVAQTADGYIFDGWSPGDEWSNRGNGAYLTKISTTKDTSYGNSSSAIKEEDMLKDGVSDISTNLCKVTGFGSNGGVKMSSCHALIFTSFGELKTETESVELYFYIAGSETADHLKIRMNKLTGKVEFVQ